MNEGENIGHLASLLNLTLFLGLFLATWKIRNLWNSMRKREAFFYLTLSPPNPTYYFVKLWDWKFSEYPCFLNGKNTLKRFVFRWQRSYFEQLLPGRKGCRQHVFFRLLKDRWGVVSWVSLHKNVNCLEVIFIVFSNFTNSINQLIIWSSTNFDRSWGRKFVFIFSPIHSILHKKFPDR